MTADEVRKFAMIIAAGLISLAGVALLRGGGPATIAELKMRERLPTGPRIIRVKAGDPDLTAEAAIALRLKTGETLYEREADRRLPVASLTKLMTALLLAEAGDPLSLVEFSAEAKEAGGPDGKRSAVVAGDRLKAEDVTKLLLASSDADAAYAAAEYVAGAGEPAANFEERVRRFVGRMNERARALGLANTSFSNPAGTDGPDNFSSARDLSALAGEIERARPEIFAASRIIETFVFGASGARYGVVNTNPLLAEFPALLGSKTGFDDEARGALLLLYRLAPTDPVALVILRSADRFADGREFLEWLESSFVIESP